MKDSREMSEKMKIMPDDENNKILVSRVHPPEWKNPEPASRYNLVVIGAGTAGLVTAMGAATMGARVALVEKHLMGGDCLNTGCVPSKAVIRSSRVVGEIWHAADFGVNTDKETQVGFPKVMERMRRLRAQISENDSAQRYRDAGVDVFLGEGRFIDRHSLEVEGKILRFKKAVIATGARPFHPPIEGLEEAGFVTSETVFSLTERPDCLAVIGGGPIGCELSQAFRRLGSEVRIMQRGPQFLPREDPEAAMLLGKVFEKEGIRCLLSSEIQKVTVESGKKVVHVVYKGKEEKIEADEILVGTGRIPNVDGLNLEAAGVEYDNRKGVHVNKYFQTTNRKIYAAGDICFPYQFTHVAEASARIVIQNALFLKSKKHNSMIIPWCTYTDPEIAHVGMYEKDAKDKGIPVDTFVHYFKDVDRAILDGEDTGFIKVHVKKGKDKILGATIVASHAGEMLSEFTLAMAAGKGLKTLVTVIHPYPTQTDAIKRVSSQYYTQKFSPFLKKVLNGWFAWRR
jgi:pyruvate/2-oxoglutarate dehydrogenase complex dihydrolipoamide dehydrogenase (E3) component